MSGSIMVTVAVQPDLLLAIAELTSALRELELVRISLATPNESEPGADRRVLA